ncbi:MAG: hypothetical protein J0H86_14485 [Xanthomonadaceae bacterium]|nr:hypothetical protein [Xanthomonadaceae bacterium]
MKDAAIRLLAELFIAAYCAARAAVGAAAALLDAGVQDMRRLYVAARSRCSG